MSTPPSSHSADAVRLSRWEEAGGAWRLLACTPRSVTVALLTCDGGEEMERFTSADPLLVKQLSANGQRYGERRAEPAAEEDA